MARSLLIRGMLVGLLAGVLMFGFGKIFGEPQVDRAIAFETATPATLGGHTHGPAEAKAEPEAFSRATQSGIGLLTGMTVYGAAFGGLFALVFAYAYGRVGRVGPRALAALLAFGGFVAITLVPMTIYPASPPSVGQSETIRYRTALYFVVLALSIAAAVGAVGLRARLLRRHDEWTATLSALGLYAAIMLIGVLSLPGIDEVPDGFPAALLWKFRLSALGLQAVLWSTLGIGFGIAAERLLAPRAAVRGGLRPLVR